VGAVESLKYIVPELILTGGGLALLMLDLVVKNKRWLGVVALLAIVAAAACPQITKESMGLFFGMVTIDPLTFFFKIAIYFIMGLVIMTSFDYKRIPDNARAEYYALLLFMTLGLTLMATSTNLLMLFLAIEFVSLVSYVLVGYLKYDPASNEAAIKYLLFGSVCSAIMAYGMSLIWGFLGTLELTEIFVKLSSMDAVSPIVWLSLILMLTGFGFKISMAPFHMWAPDVYHGAPTPITALLTVAPKSLGFAILIRVLAMAFLPYFEQWTGLIVVLSILTMTIGNVVAVSQTNIKRLLAYSSIAHAGYILMGLSVAGAIGLRAVLFYLAAYILTNLGAFFTVLIISQSEDSDEISSYAGLAQRSPFLAAALTLFFLSLAGIPPLAGFIAKWYIFAAAIEANYITLVIFAAVNTVIAAFYYLRVVKAMYLTEPLVSTRIEAPRTMLIPLGITLVGTIVFGLFPTPLFQWVQSALATFTF